MTLNNMNPEKFNKVLKNPYVRAFLFLSFVYLILPTGLARASYLCEGETVNVNNCLDASWVTSMHWALEKNLIFGRDYIFPYGSLGFLGTRTAVGFSELYFLISDLFIIGNLTFIFIYAFRKFNNLQAVLLCLLIAYSTAGGVGMYSDQIVFTYLLISVFWLNYSVEHNRTAPLVIPVVITALLFYIKVNISFISLALFYLYLFYFIFSDKENRLTKGLYALAAPALILLLSTPLKTDVFGYISGGLSLIDGYNDAMSLRMGGYLKTLVAAMFAIAIFLFTFFARNLRSNLLLLATFGIFTFVLFKQSFVRSDLHVAIFFTFFPAAAGLLAIFYKRISALQTWALFGVCLICLAAGFSLLDYPRLSERLNYFTAIFYPTDIRQRHENSFSRFELPAEIKEIIGEKSVDIIPWNINYLYFNRLNYNPRPIVQSYGAYTSYLTDLNRQKYEGDSAPEFVIFSHASIDERYPLFDDQGVKLSLIKDYACVGLYNTHGADFLLFRRNPGGAQLNFAPPTAETIKFNDVYFLKDTSKSYFIKADVDYSLLGKLVRTVYKPFPIVINFTLEDGSERRYRAVVPILEGGVLINPLIENERDFYNFAQGNLPAETKKIKSFRIDLDNPGELVKRTAWRTFKADINLSISEIDIVKGQK